MTGASLGGREAARPAPPFCRGWAARPIAAAVLLLAGIAGVWGHPARADFEAALAAYDAGDYLAAYREWLPLARSGDREAQAAIAHLHYSGLADGARGADGSGTNSAKAAWWYRRAAGCGHVIAQLNLGDFYARGVGVERDPVRASLWLGLAARAGSEWAASRRSEVARTMTARERARAAGMLSDWRSDEACAD